MNAAEKARIAREQIKNENIEKKQQKKQIRQDRSNKTKQVFKNIFYYIWVGIKHFGIFMLYVLHYVWVAIKYIGIALGSIFTHPTVLKALSFVIPFFSLAGLVIMTTEGFEYTPLWCIPIMVVILLINAGLLFANYAHYEMDEYTGRKFCLWTLWIISVWFALTILAMIGSSCAIGKD